MDSPVLDSPEKFFTIYYDESYNVRKFSINLDKNSYNVDNDKNQIAAANFMLAGIAHEGSESKADVAGLIRKLHLDPSAKELKFDQVARGNFDMVLKSQKINVLLNWLLESDLYVQYFNLNMEYWAFVDIIDDCVLHCLNENLLFFHDADHFRKYLDFHKDALYSLIKVDKEKFVEVLKEFEFPRIRGRERDFIETLNTLTCDHLVSLITQDVPVEKSEVERFLSLSDLFLLCADIDDMTLSEGLEPNILIDGFSEFYRYRIASFPHSSHIFDDEFDVEEELDKLNELNLLSKSKYKFIDSVTSHMIQISDVIAGLFGRYFNFIEKNALADLKEVRTGFNTLQERNIKLMRELVVKTHDKCEHLLFYVMTNSEHQKHKLFLFE